MISVFLYISLSLCLCMVDTILLRIFFRFACKYLFVDGLCQHTHTTKQIQKHSYKYSHNFFFSVIFAQREFKLNAVEKKWNKI